MNVYKSSVDPSDRGKVGIGTIETNDSIGTLVTCRENYDPKGLLFP